MPKPRVIVLRTAGSNCDGETKFAFELAGAKAELVHVNRLRDRSARLRDYEILAIPGGFTYGDDIAAGRVLANEMTSALAEELGEFVEAGKLVIGICNGFQVMVKTGLLPDARVSAAHCPTTLAPNDSGKFEDRWVHLAPGKSKCVFTEGIKRIYLPIAHGEGKFLANKPSVLKALEKGGQVAFRYVDPKGKSAGYPWNPNGSSADIAGIADPSGRLLGMMPHPERHIFGYQHPRWTRGGKLPKYGDGFLLFKNGVDFARRNLC